MAMLNNQMVSYLSLFPNKLHPTRKTCHFFNRENDAAPTKRANNKEKGGPLREFLQSFLQIQKSSQLSKMEDNKNHGLKVFETTHQAQKNMEITEQPTDHCMFSVSALVSWLRWLR